MFKMLTLLALMLITVFSFLLIFAPESKLNIPVLKDIRKWIDRHKIIGPGLIYFVLFFIFVFYIIFQ